MSGAEAIAVLGAISSVIAIISTSKQVYDGASNAEGLPAAFREVARRLPITKEILRSAEQHIRSGQVDSASCEAMKPLLDKCRERATALDEIFQKALPPKGDSRLDRYMRATKILGSERKVTTLMKGLLNDVMLLANEHVMETARAYQIDQLTKAIQDTSTIEPPAALGKSPGTVNPAVLQPPPTKYYAKTVIRCCKQRIWTYRRKVRLSPFTQ